MLMGLLQMVLMLVQRCASEPLVHEESRIGVVGCRRSAVWIGGSGGDRIGGLSVWRWVHLMCLHPKSMLLLVVGLMVGVVVEVGMTGGGGKRNLGLVGRLG